MSEPIDDGGPITASMVQCDNGIEAVGGLSHRDWLAGMALQGLVASGLRGFDPDDCMRTAIRAYALSDAMLAVGKEGNQP